MATEKPLLDIKDLHVGFRIGDDYFDAVDGVDISLQKNEILAIVGESGCGKSTLATTIMGLHNPLNTKITGSIQYNDMELIGMDEAKYNTVRGNDIGMIFQDPLASLNPLMTIGAQIDEALESETPEPALEALAGTVPAISVSVQRQNAERPVFEITALIPVSDSQNLQLSVSADAASHTRRITAWRETAVSGWEEQTTLPVLGSDRTENDECNK